MNVLALDLSLTATGVALPHGRLETWSVKDTGMARLSWLCSCVRAAIRLGECRVDLVVIEGYALGTSRPVSRAHALGELGGVVRCTLWEQGVPYIDVPPAVLKKYATGKGNANKFQMHDAARRCFADIDFADDNQVDAWWLHALALDAYGQPLCPMPAAHRKAIAAVHWPKLVVGRNGNQWSER